eukprot:11422906-Alexandrium_andersonii.AAC.1
MLHSCKVWQCPQAARHQNDASTDKRMTKWKCSQRPEGLTDHMVNTPNRVFEAAHDLLFSSWPH